MKRPGYYEAVEWMVLNDDTEWADYDPPDACAAISVTGALVRDLYGVDAERLRKDIRRGLDKHKVRRL